MTVSHACIYVNMCTYIIQMCARTLYRRVHIQYILYTLAVRLHLYLQLHSGCGDMEERKQVLNQFFLL